MVLREYFPDYSYKGVFFDVGTYKPIEINNSFHFEKNNWNVYCFEANTRLIDEIKQCRKNVFNYAIYDENKEVVTFNIVDTRVNDDPWTPGLSSIELDPQYMRSFGYAIKEIIKIEVPQKTLNWVIENEISNLSKIDILQIDVEGGELKVLKGFDIDKYTPKIILVEDIFGNEELHNYIISHGYTLDKHIMYNKYYKSISF